MTNLEIVYLSITLISVLFSAYSYFKDPQTKLEKGEGLMAMSIKQLQVDLTNLRDNHVHSLDIKLDEQGKTIRDLLIQVTKLSTIIDERIPKKEVY